MSGFYSTGNPDESVDLRSAVLSPLPDGGGLYVPGSYPSLRGFPVSGISSYPEFVYEFLAPWFSSSPFFAVLPELCFNSCTFAPVIEEEDGKLFLNLTGGPSGRFADYGAAFASECVKLLGLKAGCRFECAAEDRAAFEMALSSRGLSESASDKAVVIDERNLLYQFAGWAAVARAAYLYKGISGRRPVIEVPFGDSSLALGGFVSFRRGAPVDRVVTSERGERLTTRLDSMSEGKDGLKRLVSGSFDPSDENILHLRVRKTPDVR